MLKHELVKLTWSKCHSRRPAHSYNRVAVQRQRGSHCSLTGLPQIWTTTMSEMHCWVDYTANIHTQTACHQSMWAEQAENRVERASQTATEQEQSGRSQSGYAVGSGLNRPVTAWS